MKFIFVLLIGAFLFPTSMYCQEEFLEHDNGFNLSYSGTNQFEKKSISLGIHLQKGFLFGVATNFETGALYIGKMLDSDKQTSFPTKPFFLIGYSRYNSANFVSPAIGITQCFFMNRDFAFSLNGKVELILGWFEDNFGTTHIESENAYSLGYTQSFFKEKMISPIIGLSHNVVGKEQFTMYHLGLNIRLDNQNMEAF